MLRRVWDGFVYGGHLVAVGDVSSIYAFSLILKVHVTWPFLLVIYLGVLAINYFNRYKEFDQDVLTSPQRSKELKAYKKYLPLIVALSFVALLAIVSMTATLEAVFFMIALFLLGILYTLALKNFTKVVIGFKNFMTALPYALLIFFLLIYYNAPFTMGAVALFLFYFIRMFMNTAFFDIRDVASDRKSGLKTFAIYFGKDKTIKFLTVLNVLSAVPIALGTYAGLLPTYALALIVTSLYSMYYLSKINGNDVNKTLIYNVITDGEFVFYLPYVLIGKYFI